VGVLNAKGRYVGEGADVQVVELRWIMPVKRHWTAETREQVVEGYVEILGQPRARMIGLTFYDGQGRAKYVWPKPVGSNNK
jgi:hypothetical protein